MNRFREYIEGINTGTIVCGEITKLTIKRHLADVESGIYTFDIETAQSAIDFVEKLKHWKGEWAGKSIYLEPWEVFIIASIFGWKQKNGLRRFGRSYIQVARKNGKTTILALMSILHILGDGEKGSQVYCGATKEDQARILVNDAGRIIEKSFIKDKFKLFKYKDLVTRVSYSSTNSFIAAIGRDSNTQDGFDPSFANIDEFHEHETTKLLDVLTSGMGARKEPLVNIITTAGFNKNYPCYTTVRKTGIEILKGIKQDDSQFILIFEPDDQDDWQDENTWKKANPNYEVSVKKAFMLQESNKAKNEGSRTEVNFKTKHCNMWVDAPEVWIQDDVWMRNVAPLPELRFAECYGGLDFGKTLDMNAFVLLFSKVEPAVVLCWFWIPEDTYRNADSDLYYKWYNDGILKLMPGQVMSPEIIANDILALNKLYNIKSIAYDPYLATHGAVQIMDQANMTLSPIQQGIRQLSPHTKKFEEMVYGNKLNHLGNPILRWMMSNCVIDYDQNGNIKVNKKKSQNKIDGIAALINAIAQWTDFKGDLDYYANNEMRII